MKTLPSLHRPPLIHGESHIKLGEKAPLIHGESHIKLGRRATFIMSRMGITNYHPVRDIDAGIQKAILACTTMSFCVGECMACRPEDMVSRSK